MKELTKAEAMALMKQTKELRDCEKYTFFAQAKCGMVPCTAKVNIFSGYKCFYCKIVFCNACAKNHFGGDNEVIS